MKKKQLTGNKATEEVVNLIDQVAAFEEFCGLILPAIRKDLTKGLTAEKLYAKYTNLAAARGISIAMTEQDSNKALSAIKEILDRSSGKAVERVQVQHRFEKLRDEELDALLISRAKEVEEESDED